MNPVYLQADSTINQLHARKQTLYVEGNARELGKTLLQIFRLVRGCLCTITHPES